MSPHPFESEVPPLKVKCSPMPGKRKSSRRIQQPQKSFSMPDGDVACIGAAGKRPDACSASRSAFAKGSKRAAPGAYDDVARRSMVT